MIPACSKVSTAGRPRSRIGDATDAYEGTRERLARFFGVEGADRFVFTMGPTGVALSWRPRLGKTAGCARGCRGHGRDNRHANIVPWQMLAQRRGVRVEWIPVNSAGPLDYDAWCRIAEARPPCGPLPAA